MNTGKYLILESAHVAEIRNFKKTPLGTIRFTAVIQEANRENRNRRTYPKNVLEQGMKDFTVTKGMATLNFGGEAGHPTNKDMAVQSQLNPLKFSHIIRKLWWEGDLLVGDLETANNDVGKGMAGLIEQGVQVGFSLRAQGDVAPGFGGGTVVKPGLRIVGWDWVMNPSHDKAYMREIGNLSVNESACLNESFVSESLNLNEGLLETENLENSGLIYENLIDNGSGELVHFSKLYFYDDSDKLLMETYSNSFGTVKLQNGNVVKTVKLEDYLLKNVRNNILNESLQNDKKEYSSLLKKRK